MLAQVDKSSDEGLSSIYDGLWVIAYKDGHGTIELAVEKTFRSEKSATNEAKNLNKDSEAWLDGELYVVPLKLSNERICLFHIK